MVGGNRWCIRMNSVRRFLYRACMVQDAVPALRVSGVVPKGTLNLGGTAGIRPLVLFGREVFCRIWQRGRPEEKECP